MKTSASVSRVLATATLAAVLALPAGRAMAAATKGSYAGKTKAEITKTLEQRGYKVRKAGVSGRSQLLSHFIEELLDEGLIGNGVSQP